MTVIEQERVAAPAATPAAPSTEVLVLQRIRDKFVSGEWRWIQGWYAEENHGFCLVGAIREEGSGGSWWGAERLMRSVLHVNVVSWNDWHERTFAEVIAKLDEAIEKGLQP